MNRRFFLKSAGGAVLAAPLLTSIRQEAHAQTPRPPQRIVLWHTPCGCVTDRWFPKVEDGPLDASALDGTTLEPLAPYVSKLLFPRGLRAINEYGGPQTIDPHRQAMGSKLTCALLDPMNPHFAQSHSLDWEIARQVNPGGVSPLVLNVGAVGSTSQTALSYSEPYTIYPGINSPLRIYQDLGTALMGDTSEPAYKALRKKSILDAVRGDLQTYQRLNMSQSDQRRVSTWMDLLRDTELGVAQCAEAAVGINEASVTAADKGAMDTAGQFTVGADMMMNLMALSMLCDTNRSFVVNFQRWVVFKWDGIESPTDHDALAHRTGSDSIGGPCFPDVMPLLLQIDGWYATKFAKLLKLFSSIPEGDATLLDNTATTWLQELSDGAAMNLNNMPIVIAGGAGGYLRQGVSVNVEGALIGPGNSSANCGPDADGFANHASGSVGGNVPINKLYVTLMNALGCTASSGGPVTEFGQLDGHEEGSGIRDPGELTLLRGSA